MRGGWTQIQVDERLMGIDPEQHDASIRSARPEDIE